MDNLFQIVCPKRIRYFWHSKYLMRKTEYFVSDSASRDHLQQAVHEAKKIRDEYLNNNKKFIEEVIDERIDIIAPSTGNSSLLYAVITLAYFEKRKK